MTNRRCYEMVGGRQHIFERLVAGAFAGIPEANAIVLARFVDDGPCVELTGFAAAIEWPTPQGRPASLRSRSK